MFNIGEIIGEKHGIKNVMIEDKDIEIFKIIKRMYWSSNTLSDMNNKEYLDELKQYISDYTKRLIRENNNLSNTKINEIYKDVDETTESIINEFANKNLNNHYRDKMARIQNKWDLAYKNKEYDKLDKISEQIKENFYKGYYKDVGLEYKNLKAIYIDAVLDEKRKSGQELELTNNEEKAIEYKLGLFEDDYMDNFIDSFKEELRKKLEQ